MTAILLAVLICDVGGLGSPQQAQPVVDKFLRHFEKTGKWPAGSLRGAYRNTAAGCEQYMHAQTPSLVVADLATYLGRGRSWKLQPLAHLGAADAQRYYVLVRKDSYPNIKALEGKTLITTHDHDPRFVERIIFRRKVRAKHWRIEHADRPLKGLRQVARSRADATMVDQAAYRYLGELELPAKLEAIYRSPPLPGLTLAISGHSAADQQLAKRVGDALPHLCDGPGKELCTTFGVTGFVRARLGIYKRLERQYGR